MKRQSAKALLSVALVAAMIAAGAAVHGCGGVDCTINNTVTATLNFYSRSGAAVAYTDTLTVTVVGAKGDSVILNRKKNASGASIGPTTSSAFLRPFTMDANARKSSMRPLVQAPKNT